MGRGEKGGGSLELEEGDFFGMRVCGGGEVRFATAGEVALFLSSEW